MQERMLETIHDNLEELTDCTMKAARRLERDLRRDGFIGPVRPTVKAVKGFDASAQKAERKRLKKAKKERKKLLTFHP